MKGPSQLSCYHSANVGQNAVVLGLCELPLPHSRHFKAKPSLREAQPHARGSVAQSRTSSAARQKEIVGSIRVARIHSRLTLVTGLELDLGPTFPDN